MSSESSKDINLRGTNPNPTTTTIKVKVQYKELCLMHYQWRTEGVVWGGSNPPPKFRRYRWSSRSHEQEEPASRFPFVVHCVLIRL